MLRYLFILKPYERKKNENDPVSNPTYFFRKPGDDNAIKLISLDNFNKKLHEINDKNNNKELLSEEIYKKIGKANERPHSVMQLTHTKSTKTFVKYSTNAIDNKPKNDKKQTIYTLAHVNPKKLIDSHLNLRYTVQRDEKEEEEKIRSTQNKNSNAFHNQNNKTNNIFFKTVLSDNLKYNFNLLNFRIDFPLYDSTQETANEDFKIKIVQYIYAKRIYKEKDLESFLKQLATKNKTLLSENEINEIFNHVKIELES